MTDKKNISKMKEKQIQKMEKTTIQVKLSQGENLVLEKYKYEFRLRDKKEVLKRIIREFDKLNNNKV